MAAEQKLQREPDELAELLAEYRAVVIALREPSTRDRRDLLWVREAEISRRIRLYRQA